LGNANDRLPTRTLEVALMIWFTVAASGRWIGFSQDETLLMGKQTLERITYAIATGVRRIDLSNPGSTEFRHLPR
jgi:hypothetical protein